MSNENNSGTQPAAQTQPSQINIHTAPTPRDFPEMPYSANVRAIDADGFEWQFTARAVNEKPFLERVDQLRKALQSRGYKPDGRATSAGVSTPAADETAPLCAIHKTPMKKRNKDGRSWWSCGEKLDDGQWCQYRPKQ